jgi:hypothetical protein
LTIPCFFFHTEYMKGVSTLIFALVIFLLVGSFFVPQTHAASLGNLKDQITTSRPSAASPITANAASGVGQLSILNNGSLYLASDSASVIRTNSGSITQSGLNVASQSSALTTVYLGDNTSADAQAGTDVLIVPITARHTISFSTVASVPIGGHIVITFPNSPANTASPSATTFNWNNLQSSNISFANASCSSVNVATPGTVDCTLSGTVATSTQITVILGSNTPQLINPTKSATAGNADTWKITVATEDGSANVLDSSSTKVAIIESVQVLGTIEPTLTFTITGVANNINVNGISGSCGSITTNTGIATTPTTVNLGILSNGYISTAAQQLSVSTNSSTGYVISATSSGRFINPASGVWLPDANGGNGLTANDTPAPATITAGTPAFGIHACGVRSSLNGDQWVNNGTITTGKFSNPWNTGSNSFYNTLASYSAGAVTNDITAVVYAATISGVTPAGLYSTAFTYVATATF